MASSNPLVDDLYEDAKSIVGFPPEDPLTEGRARFRARGLSTSDFPVMIAEYYHQVIKDVICHFTDELMANAESLGYSSDQRLQEAAIEHLQKLYVEAHGHIQSQNSWGDALKKPCVDRLYEKQKDLKDEVGMRIRLKSLRPTQSASAIHVTQLIGSQVGNLFQGPVIQSSINSSVSQLIQKGGNEEQVGLLLRELVDILGRLGESHRAEKEELLRLVKGLLKEVEAPPEERNPSTLAAILDRIQRVALTVTAAVELTKFINEKVPMLISLLGIPS